MVRWKEIREEGHGGGKMGFVQGARSKIKKAGWSHTMKSFSFLGENLHCMGHKGKLEPYTRRFYIPWRES